jgi:hypothetical protein
MAEQLKLKAVSWVLDAESLKLRLISLIQGLKYGPRMVATDVGFACVAAF